MQTRPALQTGLSLVELMIALTIGLLLLAGLTMIFVNSSEANRELQKTAQQIENGRYASDILTQNLHHAGFYGRLHSFADPPALPDPCYTDNDTTVYESALGRPVQGFRAADLATRADISGTTCDDKGLLTNANLRPGSDVLVVRRASTKALTGASTANDVYLQATGVIGKVRLGTGAAFGTINLLNKDGTEAPIRKLMVHVYFVAPCSVGTAANGVCQAGDDSIPTLKRLELKIVGGNRAMEIVPLVEGIEYLKLEYGIDNVRLTACAVVLPTGGCSITGLTGDSMVDSYTPTPGDWSEVVAAKAFVIASNTVATSGFTDDKSYVLGSITVAPANYAGRERFRRHAYASEVRLVNISGRREIPW
jgi:type IV pilus assembly protein PilW